MEHSKTYAAALSDGDDEEFEQQPESVSQKTNRREQLKNGHLSIGGGAEGTIAPPDTLDEEFDLYESTGFVSAALHQFADDVTKPGVRVTADSEDTETWLNETFLPRAGISGGQRHQEFSQVLYHDTIQYHAAGNLLNENVKNDNGQITGFLQMNPASCKAQTEPNKPVLRAPDATESDWWESDSDLEYPTTPRDEAAAFSQYHEDSVLGIKGRFDERPEVQLSLDDVTYRPRTPPAGEIWGIPITRNIKEEVTEFKNIRKDLARAIRTKAWGIWSVAFSTEVIETKDEVLIDGWSGDEMDAFTNGLGDMEPGEIVGHDGSIEFNKMQGDVPDEVLEVLEAYVKLITAALPPPLYAVGFEDNINQFVVRQQEEIYESAVESMQNTLTTTWTPTIKQVCDDHNKDSTGIEVHIEPPEDESPIRSMEMDDLEKFALFADGLGNLFGEDAYRAFRPEKFADLVTQLPEDAFKPEAFIGVPGGIPDGVDLLHILQDVEDQGSVSRNALDAIRSRVAEARDAGDTKTSTSFVSAWDEVTGSGQGGIFGSGDDQEGGSSQEKRNPDGTLAGRNS